MSNWEDGQLEHLARTLEVVTPLIQQKHDALESLDSWAAPGSELARLVEAVPPSPVPLLYVLGAAASATRYTFESIRMMSRSDLPIPLGFLQNDLRRALMGAGRICLILGPEDGEVRAQRAREAVARELSSLDRAYKALSVVETLPGLVPPHHLIEEVRAAWKALPAPPGEGEMLNLAANAVTDLLAREGTQDIEPAVLHDHVTWLFHCFSGIAHAHAWPWVSVPNSNGAPGDFPSDIGIIASVGHLAIDLIAKASQPAH